jgi:hypothetical protein
MLKDGKFHIIFTVHFCTIDYFTPTNAPNQVLSLISLLKDYPNTHFGTFTLPSSGGSLEFFLHRPMFLNYIKTVGVVYGNIITIFVVNTLYKIVQ